VRRRSAGSRGIPERPSTARPEEERRTPPARGRYKTNKKILVEIAPSITGNFNCYIYITMSDTRGTSWSVTINNPTAADEENISLARQRGWKVEGQKEVGENGTPHYQLLVKTPQVRFSAVKKSFPRAHIEIARNVAALEQYVKKEETRVGQLETQSEMYPSLQKLWDMFYDYLFVKYEGISFELHKITPAQWLSRFDNFICKMIEEGYVVETMAVNPQIRSAIKNYGASIFYRSEIRRQKTDRQTDKNNVALDDITNAEEQGSSSSEEVCEGSSISSESSGSD